ncbi:VWA domain-containing protein [Mycolicibacterium gadium]|uniref:VWA domain-containing protein n=1 Tax=Mycolicibacterium gadium TaxID=1794 RepID=A0ABT6GXP8_MYCGU|nr:VWA domain-containing protein [Mycolicibacterium gadium]MDG5486109.1 VWA domain-containing protein [Mycolicibacterium gadium]
MTLHPVLPTLLLIAMAVLLIVAQILALRRWRASGRNRTALWRWLLISAAAVLLVFSASRVVILADDESTTRSAGDLEPNVFLVVDRSPDMAVRDLDGRTRMDVARDDLEVLVDRYPRARFAVIGFASAPSLDWPLSADTWSLRPVLDTLVPYASGPDTATQTNAGAAGTVLRYQLISAVQQYPRAKTLVFYLGAGAPESELPPREFAPPAASVDGGAVLGYGTSADEATLRGVADQLGVPFVARPDAAPLSAELPDGAADAPTTAVASVESGTETYWLPAVGAAILILIELYLVLRDLRRNRVVSVEVAT